MISAGVEGRLAYMTYPEPWRGPPKQPPEFLRPAPKPVPSISRYNGVVTSSAPNGTRIAQPARPVGKYPVTAPHAVTTLAAPVNLTQPQRKDEAAAADELPPYNPYPLYPHPPPHFPPFNPYGLYPHEYAQMIRSRYQPTAPVSPLEAYSPTTPTVTAAVTFLPPAPAAFSPPTAPPALKPGQSVLREKRTPPTQAQQPQQAAAQAQLQAQTQGSFKVPSKEVSLKGKEGSLKHRILTRPEEVRPVTSAPLDLQQKSPSLNVAVARKRLPATITSPPSPKSPQKPPTNSVGNQLTTFSKGSLIQLASGELRRIEDMRTEDFVQSAQNCPELRLADSTVVKIEEDPRTGKATITLSYNQRRTQVDIESACEHPYFVYGQGWASCRPEQTRQAYGLAAHRLQVGDVLISVTPREPAPPPPPPPPLLLARTSTIVTTATTTAMSVRPAPALPPPTAEPPLSPDSLAARKRRWSAPDQISAQEEQQQVRRIKLE